MVGEYEAAPILIVTDTQFYWCEPSPIEQVTVFGPIWILPTGD